MELKITDSSDTILKFNKYLREKYDRHPVIKDENYLFNPEIDAFSIFGDK